MKRVLVHATGDRYECPLCGHLNLVLYGDNLADCKNGCDNTAVYRKLREKLGLHRAAKQKTEAAAPNGPGLTVEQYAAAKKLDADWLRQTWNLKDTVYCGVPAVEFPYTWLALDGKQLVSGPATTIKYRWGMNGGERRNKKGLWVDLYGQAQLHLFQAEQDKPFDCCFIVEGESDTQTLMWNGFPALGVPGVGIWREAWAQNPFLAFDRTILVIQEPDKDSDPPTYKLADAWVQKIAKTFPPGIVYAVRLLADKDVSGLWLRMFAKYGFDEETVLGSFQDELLAAVEIRNVVEIAGEKSGEPQREIETILASTVTMKLTKWLWKDHVPLQHVTVFAGMPQKGKSTAAADLIARLTTGKDFPGAPNTVEPCEVIVLASEDDKDTTIVPRLVAADAELTKVHFALHSHIPGKPGSEAEVMLDSDLQLLKALLRKNPAVKLVVVDPVTSYIGDVDPNKPKEVRPFLNKLKAFAKELNVTVLIIMHLSKNPDVSALHRVGGAATWIEVPRSVWFFDLKPDQEEGTRPLTYVMVNGKLNLVADDRKRSTEYQFTGVDVKIEDQMESIGRVKWGSESDLALDGLFKKSDRQKPGPKPAVTEAAMEWLRTLLAAGPKLSLDVLREGAMAGYNKETLQEAKARLEIKSLRNPWRWSLPGADDPDSLDPNDLG
jgi:putative DNA primase/helicase